MKKTSSDLLLLDVNVLLAIAWPNHQFHEAATALLSSRNRWATCALTQLGFIRLSSNPAAVATGRSPREAAGLLARLVAVLVTFDRRLEGVAGRRTKVTVLG
jgi:uncharacterized protein